MGGQRLKDSRVIVRRVSFIRHKNKVRIKILYKRDRRKNLSKESNHNSNRTEKSNNRKHPS